ncbi:MAG: helicase associated domain-containing protein [Chthoniobacterales bacterium]|nr:helicase associated domain-containing protein [Chthoniobacterales bacterium]
MIWKFNIFEKRLVELKEFHAKHGHSNVPWNYPLNPGLGHYVCNALRGGKDKLAARQIRELDALGFIWDVREASWQRRFVELKEFLAKNKSYPTRVTNSSLASWVKSQRKIAQSQQHAGQLNSINFPWHPNEENWLKRYSELKEFKKQFGHCEVPSNIPKFHQLWDWLNYQKRQRNTMPKNRLSLLHEIDIDWSVEKRTRNTS